MLDLQELSLPNMVVVLREADDTSGDVALTNSSQRDISVVA